MINALTTSVWSDPIFLYLLKQMKRKKGRYLLMRSLRDVRQLKITKKNLQFFQTLFSTV